MLCMLLRKYLNFWHLLIYLQIRYSALQISSGTTVPKLDGSGEKGLNNLFLIQKLAQKICMTVYS